MKKRLTSGFTLIELLIVIAVIGILASVILASLNSSRNKAKDSVVIRGLQEFEKLLALEYDETGNYAALQPNNWLTTATCNSFSGNYATQAQALCNNIVTNTSDWNGAAYRFIPGNQFDVYQRYSMMATISNGKFYCVGKSGKSQSSDYSGVGCWSNP